MAKLVSKRYAKALFDIAAEKNEIDKYNECAAVLIDIFENDKDFTAIINHPSVTYEQKMDVVEKALSGRFPDDFIGLFALTLRKNREVELKDIFTDFVTLVMEHKKVTKARVVSAVSLSETQLSMVKEKLTKLVKKTVEVETDVDPQLIAGMKVFIDGRIIDGTVKSHMQELKKQLSSAH